MATLIKTEIVCKNRIEKRCSGIYLVYSLLQIFLNQTFVEQSDCDTVASISLPLDLKTFFPQGSRSRAQFHFYGIENLFQVTTNSTICTLISSFLWVSYLNYMHVLKMCYITFLKMFLNCTTAGSKVVQWSVLSPRFNLWMGRGTLLCGVCALSSC